MATASCERCRASCRERMRRQQNGGRSRRRRDRCSDIDLVQIPILPVWQLGQPQVWSVSTPHQRARGISVRPDLPQAVLFGHSSRLPLRCRRAATSSSFAPHQSPTGGAPGPGAAQHHLPHEALLLHTPTGGQALAKDDPRHQEVPPSHSSVWAKACPSVDVRYAAANPSRDSRLQQFA